MPTSTVKNLSGPPELPKTEAEWPTSVGRLRQWFRRISCFRATGRTLFAVCALLSFAAFANLRAQSLNARISVASIAPARLKIEMRLSQPTNALSFRNTYAGVLGLGERIEAVQGIRDDGERVTHRKLAPGEFESAEKFSQFAYEVNLADPPRLSDTSHVSSLNSERGVLMLADLLPQTTSNSSSFTSAVINIDVPSGWQVASNVQNEGSQFSTGDPETAVFLVAPSLKQKSQRVSATNFSMITSGDWPFSSNEAMKIAGKILREYSLVTGFDLKRDAVVMLVPYAPEAGPESWSAETRGNVVVLLLGSKAKPKKVLSRLGIVLSHELFHLWVPNSLKLAGAYDWFFEGFTLYQALRMDLRLGLISFSDYLETIASVYDSYRSSPDRNRLSLIEASERRWTTSSSLVYEKGMLVALIFDLSLRKLTDCRTSLDDIYAKLFRIMATGQGSANETIIGLLSEREELRSLVNGYVGKAENLDFDSTVSAYGIQVQQGAGTTLVVARDLSTAQRRLLGCLGYRK